MERGEEGEEREAPGAYILTERPGAYILTERQDNIYTLFGKTVESHTKLIQSIIEERGLVEERLGFAQAVLKTIEILLFVCFVGHAFMQLAHLQNSK